MPEPQESLSERLRGIAATVEDLPGGVGLYDDLNEIADSLSKQGEGTEAEFVERILGLLRDPEHLEYLWQEVRRRTQTMTTRGEVQASVEAALEASWERAAFKALSPNTEDKGESEADVSGKVLGAADSPAENKRHYTCTACHAEWWVPLDDAPLPAENECPDCHAWLPVLPASRSTTVFSGEDKG